MYVSVCSVRQPKKPSEVPLTPQQCMVAVVHVLCFRVYLGLIVGAVAIAQIARTGIDLTKGRTATAAATAADEMIMMIIQV